MVYFLETVSQIYGDLKYLAHRLTGASVEDDRYFFAQRIQSFGIINFGDLGAGEAKRISLAEAEIGSDILMRSVYAFNLGNNNDEIRFRLFLGELEIAEFKLSSNDMPYQFPAGAVINKNLSIEVEPSRAVTNLTLYWQPVHVLAYYEDSED